MRTRTAMACTAIAFTSLAACGSGESAIDERVDAVRTAVDAGDRPGAEKALDELAFVAGAAAGDGAISEAESEEIAVLIESNRQLLDQVIPTTTAPTTSTTTTTEAEPEPKPEPEPEGKKKGKGDDDKDDD